MTRAPSEFLDLVEWDWAYFPNPTVLHAIATFDGDDDLVPVGGQGVTVCGRRGRLGIPGFLSRLHMRRCRACCRILGWPEGAGSPKNDPALRELAAEREARWEGWAPTAEARALHERAERELAAFVADMETAGCLEAIARRQAQQPAH